VSAAWVAAGVRGRGLLRRRIGLAEARALAASPSLESALAVLTESSYGRDVRPGQDRASAQHAVSATVLWNLRVLAGWAPPFGAGPLRVLIGGYEISNVTGHLLELSGQPAPVPYALGSLGTVWPSVSAAQTPRGVRDALRSGGWGDPESDELPAIRIALRLAWARRVFEEVPGAADWAVAGAALVVARVLVSQCLPSLGRSARTDASRVLGSKWETATSPEDLVGHLPAAAAQLLDGATTHEQLWRAEASYWSMIEASAAELVARPRSDATGMLGVAALLAVDGWRVRAALALVGRPISVQAEVFDDVA
jgi:hypothetical protein